MFSCDYCVVCIVACHEEIVKLIPAEAQADGVGVALFGRDKRIKPYICYENILALAGGRYDQRLPVELGFVRTAAIIKSNLQLPRRVCRHLFFHRLILSRKPR